MSTEKLYPDIPQVTSNDPYLSRSKYMLDKQNQLKQELKRYEKVYNRWKDVDAIFKIISVVLTCSITTASVISGGLALPIIVPTVFAGIAAGQSTMSGVLIVGLTSKKKSLFRTKIENLNNKMNKLFIFFENAKADKDISIDEIKQFDAIINKINSTCDLTKNDLKKAQNLANEEFKTHMIQLQSQKMLQSKLQNSNL